MQYTEIFPVDNAIYIFFSLLVWGVLGYIWAAFCPFFLFFFFSIHRRQTDRQTDRQSISIFSLQQQAKALLHLCLSIGEVHLIHTLHIHQQQHHDHIYPTRCHSPITLSLYPSIPLSLYPSIPLSLHHSITPSLYHSITPSLSKVFKMNSLPYQRQQQLRYDPNDPYADLRPIRPPPRRQWNPLDPHEQFKK